ncbi:MAG TPA: SGNH/GDSL hydrolase family protein [Ideonella sp.]|nr:SGNH/GDSL hydrolase family protein [Ideonella sp.]
MATSQPVRVIDSFTATSSSDPFPFDLFECKCLAQGDSWFSFGAIPPTLTTSVLAELELARATVVVNCASPGARLARMMDTTTQRAFLRHLAGKLSTRWDAILVSGGGNDLIEAATAGPAAALGERLFLTAGERGGGPLPAEGYLSEAGWSTFAQHLTAVFEKLIKKRDSGQNRGVPMLFHNYHPVMPRPASAGFGFGPWLQPALSAFAIPPGDWLAVADALMARLAGLIDAVLAARRATDPGCELHVVDTRSAALVLAAAGSSGSSGDFANEIHPTRAGYRKLAGRWAQRLDALP